MAEYKATDFARLMVALEAYLSSAAPRRQLPSSAQQFPTLLYALRDELLIQGARLDWGVIARQCGIHRNTLAAWRENPTQGNVQTVLAVAAWLRKRQGQAPG